MKKFDLLMIIPIVGIMFFSCKQNKTLFEKVDVKETGIAFSNRIIENDSVNPIDLTNIYNGGGVGVGDFNNDGLMDLYFTGNQVANKLYLNKGDFKFEDITASSKTEGEGKWSRGVSIIDINNDGLQDIYVSCTILEDSNKRENILYVNQGIDKEGKPYFKNLAKEYGLNDNSFSTMAAFFDYDNDGDLDVYLTVNQIMKGDNPAIYRKKITDGSYPSTGKLFRNDFDTKLGHPFFTDVTKQAGVTIEGYGHGVNIADINRDGWKDIFVTNDFNSNDLLYINNHDGTFTDQAATYFKHTSANGMGQDIVDINNDGLADVVELDMSPEDNYRKKMMLNSISYQNYQNCDYFGYQYQYVRNSIQLNRGPRIGQNDSIGAPIFSEIGFLAGMSETDWSWCPMVADFDNDGYRDMIVTNGFPKDITDHDFIVFRRQANMIAPKEFTLSQIPQVKIHNYAFKNNGNLTFSNTTTNWGLSERSFSNGGAYVDLDNDGDMDVVINNINDSAFVYRNTTINANAKKADAKANTVHFVKLQLKGSDKNINGFGAIIELFYGKEKQYYEQTPYRGYLSSIDIRPNFGIQNVSKIDSIIVTWPEQKREVLRNVQLDQLVKIDFKNAMPIQTINNSFNHNTLFTQVNKELGIDFVHPAKDFVDFNIQKLIPHKYSENVPAIAVGDINGDHLDDFVVGASIGFQTELFVQGSNGKFTHHPLDPTPSNGIKTSQDAGITLVDLDNDGDLDVYIASGGYEKSANSQDYQDRVYLNDGKGKFVLLNTGMPVNHTSKSVVRFVDFDKDGDLDMFVGGQVEPAKYPKPVSSAIYKNESKNGQIQFVDVTKSIAPFLENIGLINDAIWTDFDNDGWQDIILAGEWMPISLIKNNQGKFQNITANTGIEKQIGWWTSIVSGDFDNDGDLDYIVGNMGDNTYYRASDKYPVGILAKDFDNNGSYDAVPTLYLPASQEDTNKYNFTAHNRDDLIKQMLPFRSKYLDYKGFANATIDKMFNKDEMKGALVYHANNLHNCYLKNNGKGKFEIAVLPTEAQFSAINGMIAEDFDQDGNVDLLSIGNTYGIDVSIGRNDASNGNFMRGLGNGKFEVMSIAQSGWFVDEDAKALVKIQLANGKCGYIASQNKGKLKVFTQKSTVKNYPVAMLDEKAVITFKNGKKSIKGISYGESFLSSSGRFISAGNNVQQIEIINSKGEKKLIQVDEKK